MNGKRQLILITIFLTLAMMSLSGSDQVPAAKQDHPIVLMGGVIHTVSGDIISGGEILFINGKITEVGATVSRPANVEVIDISGKTVYPGFILAESTLGLTEIGAVRATNDYREVGSINPNVRAKIAYNPDSEHIPVVRTNGIALAQVVPTGGLLSGTSAVMMLDGWTWEDTEMPGGGGVWMSWPNMVVRERRSGQRRPAEDDPKKAIREALENLDKTFDEAEAYHKAIKSGTGNQKTDLRLAGLIPVIEKKLPLYIRASHVSQIKAAVNWVNRRGYRMVLVGARDSWMVTDLLKANNIPVIISTTHSLPSRRWQPYDEAYTLPATLADAGITFALAPGWHPQVRNLPFEAGTAVGYGLDRDRAIRALTLDAATILGVGDKVGSLEPGKDATLIVVDGDPLEIRSAVVSLYIQGRHVDLNNHHRMMNEKYKQRYRQLGITD
ncbi:MAG: amidohydrolase family protein [Candidatus Marinimicrobia bacterium]|nr:amidohydrolase family protein [Candidatus Neomarinimicrobiota bacterium]